jgi:hypothetical protein
MDPAVVIGGAISITILVGLITTSLWPEPPEWQFKEPWIPPKALTEDDRQWLERHQRLTKDE